MQAVGCGATAPPSELHLSTGMTDSVSTMTSSITSSLTSPGDSGVALLDSENEVTSVSEDALEVHTPAEENLPTSPPLKLESMTNSDIANGNTHQQSDPTEVIVFRRRNKSSNNVRHSTDSKQKRVSFHEELIQTNQPNEAELNLKVETKDRYSWCEETLKPSPIQRSESSSSGGSSLANLQNELCDGFAALSCGKTGCDSSTPSNDKIRVKSAPLSGSAVKGLKEPPRLRGGRDQSVAGVLSAVRSLIAGSPSAAARSIQSLPVTERGVPEGQEDPPLSASTLDLYHHADVAERLRDGEPSKHSSADSDCGSSCAQPASPRRLPASPSRSPHLRQTRRFSSNSSNSSVLREAPSKSCLVNRFLRSLTEKKLQNTRSSATTPRRRTVQRTPRQSLYIKGARPVEELSKEILQELEEEIRSASPPVQTTCAMEMTVSPVIRERLLADVLETRIESPCKMYRVCLHSEKNKSDVMLAVLTERAIYLINHLWKASHVLLLAHLDSILLGPGSHWVRLYSNNGVPRAQKPPLKEMTLLLGDVSSTCELLSHIELAVRRLSLPGRRIPAVHRFSLEDLTSSSSWSAVLLGEVVHHTAVVHAADVCPSPPCTPLGPVRRGYFMFSHINGRGHIWTAGYFVLKAGVLYQFASEEKQMPILSLPVANLKPRLATHSRPHTLEVGHLLLAAPDEATSTDWLRSLVRAASRESPECPVEDEQTTSQIATFFLTEERILLLAGLDSSAPVLLMAPLNDLVSMQTGDQDESWCVLDLACREASESVGDFVVYFFTCSEMQSFKDCMCRLRPGFQEIWMRIPHSSPLRPRCEKMQSELSSSWSIFTSTLGLA